MVNFHIERITCAAVVGIDSTKTRVKACGPVRRPLYQCRREVVGAWMGVVVWMW